MAGQVKSLQVHFTHNTLYNVLSTQTYYTEADKDTVIPMRIDYMIKNFHLTVYF